MANGDYKQSLDNELEINNSKFPVDAILELAKTLLFAEFRVLNIFDAMKRVVGRKSISKKSKKSRKHQKSKK